METRIDWNAPICFRNISKTGLELGNDGSPATVIRFEESESYKKKLVRVQWGPNLSTTVFYADSGRGVYYSQWFIQNIPIYDIDLSYDEQQKKQLDNERFNQLIKEVCFEEDA